MSITDHSPQIASSSRTGSSAADAVRVQATILAALRFFQTAITSHQQLPAEVEDIVTGGGEFTPLTAVEIDALCEAINFGDELKFTAATSSSPNEI